MSTHTAEPEHDFEPDWNPTPTNGEVTEKLGNPFREIDTSLPIDPSIEDIERAVNEELGTTPEPKPEPQAAEEAAGGPDEALPETFTEPVDVDVSIEEIKPGPVVQSKAVDPVGKAKARAANGGGRRLGQVKRT